MRLGAVIACAVSVVNSYVRRHIELGYIERKCLLSTVCRLYPDFCGSGFIRCAQNKAVLCILVYLVAVVILEGYLCERLPGDGGKVND